tara:strand:+ start:1797 stop:2846 length:1050 start_codon:yes stop_codon:yes gene_type:complete
MATRKYDALVFIGRFSPLHNGHTRVIDTALELADKVIILVGSANQGRSMRNPFTFDERKQIIQETYNEQRLDVQPLNDVMYNDNRWIEQVQGIVASRTTVGDNIGLIGCKKDNTSFYLELFPTWGNESVEHVDNINATDIRELYWGYGATRNSWSPHTGTDSEPNEIGRSVPDPTLRFLQEFETTDTFTDLRNEKQYIEVYKTSVKQYPRIEHTVDAVVVQSGHILLIRRRAVPGKGLWALPGGFPNPNERLEDAMLRELREETKIKVPEPVLRGSIKSSKTYDDPNRSARGRIITQVFHIALPQQTTLPKVKGSDDADKARWVPLNELDPKELFEDHYFIISDLIGGV